MTTERAIEILNPEHREDYESMEPVNEACRMAISALEKQIPIKPIDDTKPRDFFINIYCSVCKEPVTKRFKYCRNCGQALDWRDDECQDQRQ